MALLTLPPPSRQFLCHSRCSPITDPAEASCSGAVLCSSRRILWLRRNPTSWTAPYQGLGKSSRGVRVYSLKTTSEQTTQEGVRFPYLPGSAKKLLVQIVEILDHELGPLLNPSQTPSDVRYFKAPSGSAEGSVVLRAGNDSKIDFALESWVHATLPFGTLDIGTVVIMLGAGTDCPHFLFEFILSGPTLVIVLDQLPRKDLVLDSPYLKRFYEDAKLDEVRQMLDKAIDAKPYVSPMLFVRSVVSPTAVVFKLSDNSQVEGGLLDEQIANVVHPAATQLLQLWLESFHTRGLPVENAEDMLKRDNQIKEKGVEVDLSSSLPRLFGQEITNQVVAAFRAGQ